MMLCTVRDVTPTLKHLWSVQLQCFLLLLKLISSTADDSLVIRRVVMSVGLGSGLNGK